MTQFVLGATLGAFIGSAMGILFMGRCVAASRKDDKSGL